MRESITIEEATGILEKTLKKDPDLRSNYQIVVKVLKELFDTDNVEMYFHQQILIENVIEHVREIILECVPTVKEENIFRIEYVTGRKVFVCADGNFNDDISRTKAEEEVRRCIKEFMGYPAEVHL